jgi:biopolymer transport protein ExbB/TolQ
MLFLLVLSGTLYGVGPALLVLAATLLVLAMIMLWLSLGELTNEEALSLEEALELAAPEHREQEKISILRGLRDLEQEHRFGKISDAEFESESGRMRSQAKQLLSSFDESVKGRRERVEERINRFLMNKKEGDTKRKSAKSKSHKPGQAL